jgi:hypothetical protein
VGHEGSDGGRFDRAHSVIQQRERTHLMNNLTPPPGWHIWVASYGGTQWRELAIFQHQGALEIPSINGDTAPHNLELTTIGIADLLFLAINSTWDRLWDVLENIVGESGAGFCRLWPPLHDTITWPRWTILTDEDARYFTTYLARVFEHRVQGSAN